MFVPGTTIPKLGEIRYGNAGDNSSSANSNNVHRYTGVRPYLVVSNDTYNKYSGQTEVIPFTTKRRADNNPVHVFYKESEVTGLKCDSTLVVESRDILRNDQLSDPVGQFTRNNWVKAAKAMLVQCPYIALGVNNGTAANVVSV